MKTYRAKKLFLANGQAGTPPRRFVYVLAVLLASMAAILLGRSASEVAFVFFMLLVLFAIIGVSLTLVYRSVATFAAVVSDSVTIGAGSVTIGVGRDGIALSGTLRSTFVPWSQMNNVEIEQKRGRNGIRLSFSRRAKGPAIESWFMIEGSPSELVSEVRRQCPRLASSSAPPLDNAEWLDLLSREEGLSAAELAKVYRQAELPDDALYALLDHPEASRELRVHAASVLRLRVDQEGGARLAAFQERTESIADDMTNNASAAELRAIARK